jgi:hypothetical protein
MPHEIPIHPPDLGKLPREMMVREDDLRLRLAADEIADHPRVRSYLKINIWHPKQGCPLEDPDAFRLGTGE